MRSPGSCLIVIIEDNPADVYLVRAALRASGLPCQLQAFDNGDSALAAFRSAEADSAASPPNLVLLDWNLPTIGGAEVLDALRQMPRLSKMPVAVLTSSNSPRDRETAARLGARRFIQKPFVLNEFIEGVGRHMKELVALES